MKKPLNPERINDLRIIYADKELIPRDKKILFSKGATVKKGKGSFYHVSTKNKRESFSFTRGDWWYNDFTVVGRFKNNKAISV